MTKRLYFNGVVRTMSSPGAKTDRVLTEAGQILRAGNGVAEAPDAQRIDLRGQTLIPGLSDPHGYFPESGFNAHYKIDLTPPPLGDCATLADALERIAGVPGEG